MGCDAKPQRDPGHDNRADPRIFDAQPFRPFVLHLADGREIPILHREFMASAPSGRTLAVYQPDDTVNSVDLLLVADLEFKPVTNGKSKRKKD